jgi:hypothetical protein
VKISPLPFRDRARSQIISLATAAHRALIVGGCESAGGDDADDPTA